VRWRRSGTLGSPSPAPVGWLLVPAAATAAVLLCWAQPAYAHASLVGATPAVGSTVQVAPTTVVLRFDENIRSPSLVVVKGPDGRTADHGPTSVVDNTARVAVTVTQPGRYTVAYRVLSSDGHPVADQTSFSYRSSGGSSGSTGASPPAASGSSDASGTEGGTGSTGWVVGGVAAALVAAAALLLVGRRRQPAASDTEGDTTTEPGRTRTEQ
jgi:copper resistance protein C